MSFLFFLNNQAILEPQRMAMKKINRMQKKKEAKKRKMANFKEMRNGFKKRRTETKSNNYEND